MKECETRPRFLDPGSVRVMRGGDCGSRSRVAILKPVRERRYVSRKPTSCRIIEKEARKWLTRMAPAQTVSHSHKTDSRAAMTMSKLS